MKTCPFCQVENGDDAQRCRFCGRDLDPPIAQLPWEDSPEPTQPVRPAGRERPPGQERPAGSTQPLPPTPPPGNWPPPQAPQYGASQSQNDAGHHGGTGPTLSPNNPRGYRPTDNNAPPPGGQYASRAGGYPPIQPPPGAQIYTQPYPERPKPRSDRPWIILAGVLGLLLLCMGGAMVWILTSSAAGGLGRAGDQLSTQAAGVFGTPAPTATLVEPSPWPTFTTAPTFTPQATFTQQPTFTPPPTDTPPAEPSPTPEVTQESSLEKYLTPECAAALDNLERLSKAVTEQPGLTLEAAWRTELSQSVGEVRAQCGSLERASPVPGLMAEAQQNLDNATQEFDEANRLFKEGIDEFNPGKVFQAGQHLAEATKYLNQALRELRKIGD